MTKTGYLTRIALAALVVAGGAVVGIILDHAYHLPPMPEGEREPEQTVEPLRIVRGDNDVDRARRATRLEGEQRLA